MEEEGGGEGEEGEEGRREGEEGRREGEEGRREGQREKRGGGEIGQFCSPFPLCSGWVRQSQTLLLTTLQHCRAERDTLSTYASGQSMSMCPMSKCVCRMSQYWHGILSILGHRCHMITSSNHMITMVSHMVYCPYLVTDVT